MYIIVKTRWNLNAHQKRLNMLQWPYKNGTLHGCSVESIQLSGLPELSAEGSPASEELGADPWSGKIPCHGATKPAAPRLLIPCSRARELQLLRPLSLERCSSTKRSHCNDFTAQLEATPFSTTKKSPHSRRHHTT